MCFRLRQRVKGAKDAPAKLLGVLIELRTDAPQCLAGRCLTLRSSGPPPASRLARAPASVIIRRAGQAPSRWGPLSSNVRRHTTPCARSLPPSMGCRSSNRESTSGNRPIFTTMLPQSRIGRPLAVGWLLACVAVLVFGMSKKLYMTCQRYSFCSWQYPQLSAGFPSLARHGHGLGLHWSGLLAQPMWRFATNCHFGLRP